MPIYEYQCQECKHRLEALQQLSEPPLTTCPECEGELRKLFSAPAFQFKGSGWYVTDYARKGGEKQGKEAGSSEKSDAKAEKAEKSEKADKAAGSDSKESKGSTKSAAGAGA